MTVSTVYNKSTKSFSPRTKVNDYNYRNAKLEPQCLYFFTSMYHKVKEILASQPDHFRQITFDDEHAGATTHSLSLWKPNAYRIPNLFGKRCPAQRHLLQDGDAKQARYLRLFTLTLFKPWSARNPLFDAEQPITDECVKTKYDDFIAGVPKHCKIIIDNLECFHQQKEDGLKRRERQRLMAEDGIDSDNDDGSDDDAGYELDDPDDDTVAMAKSDDFGLSNAPEIQHSKGTANAYRWLYHHVKSKGGPPAIMPEDLDAKCKALLNVTATPATLKAWSTHTATETTAVDADAQNGISYPARIVLVNSETAFLMQGNATVGSTNATKDTLGDFASVLDVMSAFNMNDDVDQQYVFRFGAAALLKSYLNGPDTELSTADADMLKSTKRDLDNVLEHQLLFVTGPGGHGKSNCIKALHAFARSWNVRDQIRCAAPTGFAAQHIEGVTLHNLGSIPARFSFTQTKGLPRNFQKYQNAHAGTSLYVLDELSMVPAQLLGLLSKCLAYKVGKPTLAFGGVNVIVLADFFQMPPVGTPARLYDYAALTASGQPLNKWADAGLKIWESIKVAVQLKKNYRAPGDYSSLLSRVRKKSATEGDLALLKTRVVGPTVQMPPGTMIVTYTNERCYLINRDFGPLWGKLLGRKVFVIRPTVTKSAGGAAIAYRNNSSAFVGGTAETSSTRPFASTVLYVGQSYTINMDNSNTGVGLCNNIVAVLLGSTPPLDWYGNPADEPEEVDPPLALLFEIRSCTAKYENLPDKTFPLQPSKLTAQSLPGVQGNVTVEYFPARARDSGTLWKVQGDTLENVAMDGLRGGVENGTYVGLSRTRRLEKLFLMPGTKVTNDSVNGVVKDGHRMPPALTAEMTRIASLSPTPS